MGRATMLVDRRSGFRLGGRNDGWEGSVALPGGLVLDVFSEGYVDVRLVSATAAGLGLEPGYDVRIEPQRNLLLYRAVEDSSPGVGPVQNLRSIGCIDLMVSQSLQRLYLLLYV